MAESEFPSLNLAVVIDIDNTLLHTIRKEDLPNHNITQEPDYEFGEFSVFLRPWAIDTVNKILNDYEHVFIWSFGTYAYVSEVIKALRPKKPFKHVYTFDRPPPGKNPLEHVKKLELIDKAHNVTSFIIDDQPMNSIYNPDRVITINPFYVGMNNNDRCLKVAHKTLNVIIYKYIEKLMARHNMYFLEYESDYLVKDFKNLSAN